MLKQAWHGARLNRKVRFHVPLFTTQVFFKVFMSSLRLAQSKDAGEVEDAEEAGMSSGLFFLLNR